MTIIYLANINILYVSFTRKPIVLNLVYSNVCGPIEVKFLRGNRYFGTFVDDASRKV
jgi:hypothetical protein